jgi:pimeloyl-ACP methyl ester carboxylesterase
MSFITTNRESGIDSIQIFYQEYGQGIPVIFIHGWPLNHEMWEYQILELSKHNIRCIAYDRRGFGKSDRPWQGYDYDTLADDLHELITQLDLSKVVLIGFSMGGGEVARYIGKYGTGKLSKVAFISSVTPCKMKSANNPDGSTKETIDATIDAIKKDRPAFLAGFGKKFYGVDETHQSVSQELLNWNQNLCLMSSAKASIDCVHAFSETDFSYDLQKIDIPVLIIHGDADKIVPISGSGNKTAELIKQAKYIVYHDSPHGLFITDKEKLNKDLLDFIAAVF